MFCLNIFLIFVALVKVMSTLESEPSPGTVPDSKNATKNLQWWDCGGDNATVRWEEFHAEDPIRMERLTVGAKYRILEEVRPKSYSRVEVWRVFNLFVVPLYVKIPCIGKFGSCNYDICRIMDRDNFCSFQRENNAGCGCPMAPKVVEGYEYKARIPSTKFSTFQQLYANGLYQLRWTWFNPEGVKIGCLEGRANVRLS